MLIALSRGIDTSNKILGKTIAYCTLAMAVITFLIVVLRYGFNLGWVGMQESVTYLHAAVFLLGSAYTYQQQAHVRVDVFYRRFSARTKHIVDLFGCILFLLPLSIFITYYCWHYVMQSWQLLESSREPGGLPFVYILKSFLLVFSITMCLQALSEIIKHALFLTQTNGAEQ